jgi:hypothetical protein
MLISESMPSRGKAAAMGRLRDHALLRRVPFVASGTQRRRPFLPAFERSA